MTLWYNGNKLTFHTIKVCFNSQGTISITSQIRQNCVCFYVHNSEAYFLLMYLQLPFSSCLQKQTAITVETNYKYKLVHLHVTITHSEFDFRFHFWSQNNRDGIIPATYNCSENCLWQSEPKL